MKRKMYQMFPMLICFCSCFSYFSLLVLVPLEMRRIEGNWKRKSWCTFGGKKHKRTEKNLKVINRWCESRKPGEDESHQHQELKEEWWLLSAPVVDLMHSRSRNERTAEKRTNCEGWELCRGQRMAMGEFEFLSRIVVKRVWNKYNLI